MPELPEAETIARQLDLAVRGMRFGKMICHRTDIVRGGLTAMRKRLPGSAAKRVSRRGKRVVIELDPAGTIVVGLGMTGQLLVVEPNAPRDRHVHLRAGLSNGTNASVELRFRDVRRFGGVWFAEGNDERIGLNRLGPEPLDITAKQFARLMRRHRQIKALLLDQHAIAGMGNIYCDEALHIAGVHPLTRASDLPPDRVAALYKAVRSTLRSAIRAGGSTLRDYRGANGDEGKFQISHRVYGRKGQPCTTCGGPIVRIVAAGRSSHVCLICQPLIESSV